MKTNGDRRREKLETLCAEHGIKRVAQKSRLSVASLDQVLKVTLNEPKKDGTRTRKLLGDSAARAIETAFKLGTGWFDTDDVMPSSTESLSYAGVCTKITSDEKTGIKWDSRSEVPIAMPYTPERLKSAVMLIGSLLGALDDRSRKTIGNVLHDLAAAPDEASYFADIAVSAAKTQKPLTENPALERALRPHARN